MTRGGVFEKAMSDPEDGDEFDRAWRRGVDGKSRSTPDFAPIPNTGRRAAPRLRVSLPARLIAIKGEQQCVLMNLSRSGAQVAVLDSISEGEGVVLKCGQLDAFGVVIRSEFGLNAIEFEDELSDQDVLDMRRYYEEFEDRERHSLIETARKWVTGTSDDDRAL
jgi:hypothetical protein